jgi:penicillin-binding protein A
MKETIRIFWGLVAASAIAFGLFFRTEAEKTNRTDVIWLLSLLVAGIALVGLFWGGTGFFANKKQFTPEERLRHYTGRVSSAIMVCFILIAIQTVRHSVVNAELVRESYTGTNRRGEPIIISDPRNLDERLRAVRGRIFDASGKEVAGVQIGANGYVKRTYAPNNAARQLLGYYNPGQFGSSGIEQAFDEYLTGQSNELINFGNSVFHRQPTGNDVYLTIDPDLQRLAQTQLGDLQGAIVLLDAKTGAVLAMAGKPNFDPEPLAFDPTQPRSGWNAQTTTIQNRFAALNRDAGSPLLPRATQGVYVPGSMFKTVTLAAILDSGKATAETVWNDPGFIIVDSQRIDDPNRPDRNKTQWNTREGYMFSLNAVFAQMGLQLGGQAMLEYGERTGFEKPIPFDLPTTQSEFVVQNNFLARNSAIAETAFGQGQLLMNPLHAALVAAAYGRGDGVLPRPYLVSTIKTKEGAIIRETRPENWTQAVRPETARVVRDIMVASATEGYVGRNGGGLPGSGAIVGGKTGTAELGGGFTNATYLAWAEKGDKIYAISVIIHNGRGIDGLGLAMPRANALLRAVLAKG